MKSSQYSIAAARAGTMRCMLKRDLDRHFLLLQPSNTPLCMALFSAHDFLPIGDILQGMKYDQGNSHFSSLPSDGLTRSKGTSCKLHLSSIIRIDCSIKDF